MLFISFFFYWSKDANCGKKEFYQKIDLSTKAFEFKGQRKYPIAMPKIQQATQSFQDTSQKVSTGLSKI